MSRAELQALADKVDELVQLFKGLQMSPSSASFEVVGVSPASSTSYSTATASGSLLELRISATRKIGADPVFLARRRATSPYAMHLATCARKITCFLDTKRC